MTTLPLSLSFPKNPDPNANLLKDIYGGFKSANRGTLRPRYDILKDLGATYEQQREMKETTGYIAGLAFIEGVLVSALVVTFVYLIGLMI